MFDPATAIIGAGVLGAGAGLLGSSMQSDAAESAAQAQAGQGANAIAFQREMFNKLLELNQPFYNIGKGAIPAYMNYLGLPYQQQLPSGGGGQPQGNAVPKDLSTMMDAYNAYRQANTAQVPEMITGPGGEGIQVDQSTGRTIPQFNGLPLDQWLLQQANTPQATAPVNNLSRTVTPWTRFDREGSQTPTPPIVRSETLPEVYRRDAYLPDHIPTLDTSGYTGGAGGGNVPPGMEQYGPTFNSPMYQWRLQEGTNALNNALRARGKYDSTVGLRSIGDLTNQLTAEETEKSYNRLLDAIKIGTGAAGTAGAGAMQTGQGVANTYNQIGNALAQGQIGQGNAWGSFASGLGGMPLQLASMNYLMKQPASGSYYYP